MKKYLLLLSLPLLLWGAPVQAAPTIPDRPSNNVYDQNHYLSYRVINKVADFNANHSSRIAVYVEPTMDGEDIDAVAKAIATKWGKSTAKIWEDDDSEAYTPILLAMSIDEGLAKLEVPSNASGAIAEKEANSIIAKNKERLQNQEYDSAALSIIDNVASILNNEEYISETTESLEQAPDQELSDLNENNLKEFAEHLSWSDPAIITLIGSIIIIFISFLAPFVFFILVVWLVIKAAKQQNELNNNPNNPSNNADFTSNGAAEFMEAVATKQSIFSSLKSLFKREETYSNVPFENIFDKEESPSLDEIPTYQEWKDKNK